MSSPRIKILFVEDHADTLYAVSHMLVRRDFDVVTAIDVATGIAVGRATTFDVLVCDIGLPDGKGTQVLSELRKLKSFPAVALTGYGMPDSLLEIECAGFERCITKPSSTDEIVNAIEHTFHEFSQRGILPAERLP